MPMYTYKARIDPKTFRSGTIEAESQRAAINKLLALNYHPISVAVKTKQKSSLVIFDKISQKDIYIFLRQLSNLIHAGLPIVKALSNISGQTNNQKFQRIIQGIKEKIQKGKTFSEALSDHPEIFSSLEINMIKSAETTGSLPEASEKIADLKERDMAFFYRIRSALAYPVLLVSVGFLTLFALTTFVLPRFVTLFSDLDQELPFLTQILIQVSLFFQSYWIIILGVFGITATLLFKYTKTPKGNLWFDAQLLKVPALRSIIIKVQTARFARTLSNLLDNGVPVINSLKIVADVMTNMVFKNEVNQIHAMVVKGQHISESLKSSLVFEKNTIDLIAVGEESGKLDDMLLRIAQMSENESSVQIDMAIFMIEPILILGLGVIIAGIVMAILLPIFQMNFLIQ